MAKWDQNESNRGRHARLSRGATHDLATLVSRSLPRGGRAVLAVSGGLDSMALLDVASAVRKRRGCALVVATFDHGSGEHSAQAAAFVADAALAYGVPAVIGRSRVGVRTEAAWRAARWEFLRSVSRRVRAPVVTAHTRDDQIETVLMRALRDAGARGLAGLYASSRVRRPFVDVRRAELQAYASARGLCWVDDPSNDSREYLRNRVRHELLPALYRARPSFGEELLQLGERAAAWRNELTVLVDASIRYAINRRDGLTTLDVAVTDLAALTPAILKIVWPDLAARVHLMLDRRGTQRATAFTLASKAGGRIQLSGGWELIRSREWFELRATGSSSPADDEAAFAVPMTWNAWGFTKTSTPSQEPWTITVPAELALRIRAWKAGDRLTIRHGDRLVTRKVKYFLSDARISGHIRARWPVVLAGDEIVWIPGVRRSDAATARSGGPVVTYVCDYLDRRP